MIPPPARTAADHRRYDDRAVDLLRFIRGAKRLGLRLGDIAQLLAVRDTGTCPCEPAASLLRRRLEEIDAEITRLTDGVAVGGTWTAQPDRAKAQLRAGVYARLSETYDAAE